MKRSVLSFVSIFAALLVAWQCFAQVSVTGAANQNAPGGGVTPVTFDAQSSPLIQNVATTNDVAITTGSNAKTLLAFHSQTDGVGNEISSSVVWDPGGAGQNFTQVGSTQCTLGGNNLCFTAWALQNPTGVGGGSKNVRFNVTAPDGTPATFFVESYNGGTAVSVGASCGQGTTDPTTNLSHTDNVSTSANHMGVIFQRGSFINSNSASWSPTPDASNSATGSSTRVAWFHNTGSFGFQITFDVADVSAWICMDIAP